MYGERRDRGDRDRGFDRGGDRGGGFRGNFGGGGGFQNNNNRFAPVREGDEIDVKIEAVGEKGDGIAKKQGFVLFVPKTKAGDEVRIKVTRVLKNAGFAEVIGAASGPIAGSDAPAQQHQRPAKKQEEEFNPKTEDDSENFGEPEAEEVTEESDDDEDENSEEKQEE
jgi:predicted RNA-binding protein with TRAM domain